VYFPHLSKGSTETNNNFIYSWFFFNITYITRSIRPYQY